MSATTVVTARPLLMARIGWACAVLVVAIFVVIALVMPRDNAGAIFGYKDQIGTGVLGLLIAAGFWLLTRPRMIADTQSVRTRSGPSSISATSRWVAPARCASEARSASIHRGARRSTG